MNPIKIDHILLGIDDLDKGIAEFEHLTGVKPEFGGVHPNIGTHNALVSLGSGTYLEIIAPQEKDKKLTGPFRGFEDMESLGLIGWALQTENIDEIVDLLNEHKIRHSGKLPGSRKTPDNKTLKWATSFRLDEGATSIQPFFIQWDDMTLHPSLMTPNGCTVHDYSYARNNDVLGKVISGLSLDINREIRGDYESGTITNLILDTPKGRVRFS